MLFSVIDTNKGRGHNEIKSKSLGVIKMKFLYLFLFFTSLPCFALTGDEIAQKVYQSNRDKDSITKTKMTLVDKSGNKRDRVFYSFTIDNNRFDSQSLIYFTEPVKINKIGLLIHNTKSGDTNQWLYLPALKKTRRISSGNKSGRFVSSDLTYQDLEDREVELDNHKLLKEETIKGKKYYILESTPKSADNSIYTKSVSWIDPSMWVVKQVNLYKGKTTIHKKIISSNFKKYGASWKAEKTLITDFDLKHKTMLELLSVKQNIGLDAGFFNKSILENPRRLIPYLK